MSPTLIDGDNVLVCKVIPGARLFNLFAVMRGEHVRIYRTLGLRKIARDDVVVFNTPYPNGGENMRMHIMKYYVKRCAGLPGDSLLGGRVGEISPVYIPKAGDSISFNHENYLLYYKLIAWEQQGKVEQRDSLVYLNGEVLIGYRFQKNYYYMIGDNAEYSQDSRYWGLLPEEYIVGKAWINWKSKDPFTGKFRWNLPKENIGMPVPVNEHPYSALHLLETSSN
ncbi:signal peptidase I [Bacteroidia bacterium]|nr:signal peptidase I [Bacteroidia bacterium]